MSPAFLLILTLSEALLTRPFPSSTPSFGTTRHLVSQNSLLDDKQATHNNLLLSAARSNQLYRTVRFWCYVVPVLAQYGTTLAQGDSATDTAWLTTHAFGGRMFRACVDELGGFYVKVGQIVATRQDLFPPQYAEALNGLTDFVDPLPPDTVRAVVQTELGKPFDHIFDSWDDTPLGAASVAQVHRAIYNDRQIAVKVQRPGCESLLLNDVSQLKNLARLVREQTPVDYYVVFAEIEKQLADEFDFVKEAAAMCRIKNALADDPPLVVPSIVPELCTRRVLAMDLVPGEPLARFADVVTTVPRPLALSVLQSLTTAFGRCVLETGFFHADPHPGNLLVDVEKGTVGLIDYGQVKQISGAARSTLGKIMIALADRTISDSHPCGSPEDLTKIAELALDLGVELDESLLPEGPAAVAIWLFDDAQAPLPGDFEQNELSPKSPAYALTSFPSDLVLVARSTVLIKGLAYKLGCSWSLADDWAKIARSSQYLPAPEDRVRFKTLAKLALAYAKGKLKSIARPLALRLFWGRNRASRFTTNPKTSRSAPIPADDVMSR